MPAGNQHPPRPRRRQHFAPAGRWCPVTGWGRGCRGSGRRLPRRATGPLPGRGAAAYYYLRQLRDWKYSADIEGMNAAAMTGYGRLCRWTLASAHAGTRDPIAIVAYLA